MGAAGGCFASPKLREGVAGCRGRKGKREQGPSKTPHPSNSAPLEFGNIFFSQAPQFPHLPGRSVQAPGANLASPLGELGVVWESRNSLSVNAARLLQQGMGHLLESWPEGAAVLSQPHTAGISWGRLTRGKNKATSAHLPQVLSQEHKESSG